MCGEQYILVSRQKWMQGSPPRVRGTDLWKMPLTSLYRITPACAGNSSSFSSKTTFAKDHPRVCGEQMFASVEQNAPAGSPPRVRGTAVHSNSVTTGIRITPACAGNRYPVRQYTMRAADHPRVCGEQTKKSPSFLHSFLSDQENSFSLKYNCSISSQSFCARWTSLQGSSKCFAKVDS